MSQTIETDEEKIIMKKENLKEEDYNICREKYLNNLGNILIINKSDNSRLSNKHFSKKKEIYQDIKNQNRGIKTQFMKVIECESEVFGFIEIKERNKELINTIKQIYE